MNCTLVSQQNLEERYVQRKLAPEEGNAYERHFFKCDHCYRKLQQLLAIREELEKQSLKAVSSGAERATALRWLGWPAFAGIVVAIVALTISFGRKETLADLARIGPPLYEAPVLRGVHDVASTAFRDGMTAYVASDYAAATAHLQKAAAADPFRPDIAFYLGASELLAGRPEKARAEFERLIAMGGGAYLEEAHFYLGKTLLRMHRVADARREFERVIEMAGPLNAEAKTILDALARLERGTGTP